MDLLYNSFGSGLLGADMRGRSDLPEYYRGCRVLKNVIVKPTGGVVRRPGTEHIASAYSSSISSRLVPFVNKSDKYTLEFSDEVMRVFKSGALLGAPYELTTPYAAADVFDVVFAPRGRALFHPDYVPRSLACDGDTSWSFTSCDQTYGPFLDENTDTDSTIAPSGTSGSITLTATENIFDDDHIGSVWKISHSAEEQTVSGYFTGTANSAVLTRTGNWAVHAAGGDGRAYCTVKLQKSEDGGSSWIDVRVFELGGAGQYYKDKGEERDDGIQYRMSCTAHASGGVYYQLRFTAGQQNGLVEITAVASATSASATVLNELGDTYATYKWSEPAWSPYRGYPSCGTMHESRIIAANTDHQPTGVWGGQSFKKMGNEKLFYAGVNSDDAWGRVIEQEDCNLIEWVTSMWVLLIGSDGNIEKGMGPGEFSPMTPKDANFLPQAGLGAATIQPVKIAGFMVYAGRNAKRVYEMTYSDDAHEYQPEDLTHFASDVMGSGLAGWCFQQQPYPILWGWTTDGDVVSLTRDRQLGVKAWSQHDTDGTVESMTVIPGETEDEVWLSVARTANGSTIRSIERMKPFDWGSSQRDCFFVDGGTTWDGGAAVTITGLAVDGVTDKVTVTASGHGMTDGYTVRLDDVAGMTEVNGHVYTVADSDATTFVLKTRDGSAYIDGSEFTTYTSGGTLERVTNSVTGLTHLAAESVTSLLDGQPGSGTVTAAGVYTVGTGKDKYYHNTIHVGRSYTYQLTPSRPEVTLRSGSIQALEKKITSCKLRVLNSAGGSIGSNSTDVVPIDYGERGDLSNADVTLSSKDVEVPPPGSWSDNLDIYIEGDGPLPIEISAILFGLETA